jgi:multidrug resistance efflux pump
LLPQLTAADRNKAAMTRTIRGLLDRLAQRIPVRIKLDDVPSDLLLVAGRTATVSIGKIRWW